MKNKLSTKFKMLACLMPTFLLASCSRFSFYDSLSISYEELNEKKTEEKSFFLILYSKSCSACHSTQPLIEEYYKTSDVPFYTLEIYSLSDEQAVTLANEIEQTYKDNFDNYQFDSVTPDNYDDSFFYQSLVTPTFILYKSFQMVDVRFGFDSTKYTLEEMFDSMLQS